MCWTAAIEAEITATGNAKFTLDFKVCVSISYVIHKDIVIGIDIENDVTLLKNMMRFVVVEDFGGINGVSRFSFALPRNSGGDVFA